jgi:hypothetical protein
MDWIIANIDSLIAIFTAVVTLASIIAKLTPTEVDNRIVGYALRLIDFLAINNKPTEIN